jgi:hypothetical protein
MGTPQAYDGVLVNFLLAIVGYIRRGLFSTEHILGKNLKLCLDKMCILSLFFSIMNNRSIGNVISLGYGK